MTEIKVSDCYSPEFISVSTDESISTALTKMKKYNLKEIPVTEKNTLIGIIKYSDITTKKQSLSATAKHLVVKVPQITTEDTLIKVSKILFDCGLNTIPVVEKKNIIGIISRQDIMNESKKIKEIQFLSVRDIMNSIVYSINENENIGKARDIMRKNKIQVLPVLNKNNKLSGIVNIRDITSTFLDAEYSKSSYGEKSGEKTPIDIEVKSIMSTPITTDGNTNIINIIDLVAQSKTSSVIITEEDKPIGIVTDDDVLRFILKHKIEKGVYIQITGLENEEPSVLNVVYEIVEKYLRKTNRVVPIVSLLIHITRHSQRGNINKFSVHAKLQTKRKMFISQSVSQRYQWDMMKSLTDVMMHLDRQVKQYKKKMDKRTKTMI